MSEGYPGEHSTIPKRVTELLKYQPINHIIPKSDLSKYATSVIEKEIVIDRKESFHEPPSEYWLYPNPIDFDPLSETVRDPITFRRPAHLHLVDEGKQNPVEVPFLTRLPKLAIKCLTITGLVESKQILTESENALQNNTRRKRTNNCTQTEIRLSCNASKRLKNGAQMMTLSQVESGEKSISELEQLAGEICSHEKIKGDPNAAYWMHSTDGGYILKPQILEKLSLIINKILSFPNIGEQIDECLLKGILKICTSNIRIILRERELNLSYLLESTGLLSSNLILEILMIDVKKYSLQLEEYVSAVFDYVDNILNEFEKEDAKTSALGDFLSNCNSFASLLLIFVKKQHFLDEPFITRTICSISELLLLKTYHSLNSTLLTNLADTIRDSCIEILVFLFQKFKSQRRFILEEVLSRCENVPSSRSVKKLKQLDFTESFASHFTVTIVKLLQTINIFQACGQLNSIEDHFINFLSEELKDCRKETDELIIYISSHLFEKSVQNFPRYKFIMDSYFQDLLSMLDNVTCSSSVLLLTSMQTRIFQVFKPQQSNIAVFEPFALQLTGFTAAKLLEISLLTKNTRNKSSNDISKDSEIQKRYFGLCTNIIDTIRANSGKSAHNAEYFWNNTLEYCIDLRSTAIDTESVGVLEDTLKKLLEIPSHNLSRNVTHSLNYQEVQKNYSEVLLNGKLYQVYEPCLKLILSLLNQSKIKLKSGAIKCLSLLVSKDQNMLASPIVNQTIKSRLLDPSASVRDAMLDFLDSSSSVCQFYREINTSFEDSSVSIRKHVLKMNEKIYDNSENREIKAFVLEKILKRIEDEEDTIIETARLIVLERLVLSLVRDETDVKIRNKCSNEVISILRLLLTYGEKTNELLEFFFHFYVLNRTVHEGEEFQRIRNGIEIITERLVQTLLDIKSEEEDIDSNLVPVLELLLFVALLPGSFIRKNHLSNLFPYLNSEENPKARYLLLKVFRSSVKKTHNLKHKFMAELETSLLSKITKFNTKEIDEAMALCWDLSEKSKNYDALARVCTSCITQLKPYAVKAVNSPESIESDGRIQRLLYISTAFARVCRFKESAVELSFLRKNERLFEYVTKCLLGFTHQLIDANLRKIAIKNLVRLATSFPKLFNARPLLKVLDSEFLNGSITIKLAIIECLHDFLLAEEKKALMKTGVNGTVSSNAELRRMISTHGSAESVNDGVCSALVARYLDSILEISLHANVKEAISALNFLKLILNFNYINPASTVPTLVALLCSPTLFFKVTSRNLLSQILEQYESMVFNGISLGIKKCIEYLKSINCSKFYSADTCIHDLQVLLSNNKKNTRKFSMLIKTIFLSECSKIYSEDNDAILFLSCNMTKIVYADQLELYTLISGLTPICEEFEESIQDILSVRDDEDKYKKAYSLLVRKKIIEKFKNFVFENAHLSSDKLNLVGTPDELTLKGKNIIWNQSTSLIFEDKICLKPSDHQMKLICDIFLEECENEY